MTSDLDRIQHVLDAIVRIKGFVSGMDGDIRAMRNILVHDYVRTDVDQLWLVVENDLDDLTAKMTAAKESAPSPTH